MDRNGKQMDRCSGARLLALAYSKIEGIDSLCIAQVVKLTTIRVWISLAASLD